MASLNLFINFLHEISFLPFPNKWDRNKKKKRGAEGRNKKKPSRERGEEEGEGDKKLNVLTIKLNPELMANIIMREAEEGRKKSPKASRFFLCGFFR
jgi:hypothetical protein